MKEMMTCVECETQKPITEFCKKTRYSGLAWFHQCKYCRTIKRDRSSKYWQQLFKKYKTICKVCSIPRKLIEGEDTCIKCLKEAGYKYCNKCNTKKLIFMDFYNKRSECKNCSPNKELIKKPTKKGNKCRRCKVSSLFVNFYSSEICSLCHTLNEKEWLRYIESDNYKAKLYLSNLTPQELYKDNYLKKTYQISLLEFNSLSKEQGETCFICKSSNNLTLHYLNNKIEKLLCNNCLNGLNSFKNSNNLLTAAADYIKGLL